jgi:beta-xylosidase
MSVARNPILRADFPDPDVIRVGDSYYMVSTTMHFMPGAAILRSFDLANWEILAHAYDRLDSTPAQRLSGDESIYGRGMWAGSLRYREGEFFLCFIAYDTRKTYLLRSSDPAGPWSKAEIEGFYHDPSLLFDDDGRVFIAHGNAEIRVTELDADFRGPKSGGLDRVVVRDLPGRRLGYEGSHLYKIGGRYYLFLIHWLLDGSGRRTQACFRADSLDGEFSGRDVLDDDLGYLNQGVAQGGIVDTPEGDWYAMLFQDRGAVGRVPVLVPLRWEEGFPVLGAGGKAPIELETRSTRPGHAYAPIAAGDDFGYLPGPDGRIRLSPAWEWNHEPDDSLWYVDAAAGRLGLRTGRLSENLTRAQNVLTQRCILPSSSASVRVDGSALRDGDFAGISVFQGKYGMVALTRERGAYYLVMLGKPGGADMSMGVTLDKDPGVEYARLPWPGPEAELRVSARFDGTRDEASFFYRDGGDWAPIGAVQRLWFGLDHFAGCRFGLFVYSTRMTGGEARFGRFENAAGGRAPAAEADWE